MKKILSLIALCIITTPLLTQAAVLRSGDDVIITNDQEVRDDFYAAGEQVSSSGDVLGDFYAAAGTFTKNGSVDGDIFVLAGVADLHGEVSDDVRIIAGEVTVADTIEGDLVVLAGALEILSTASVGGDVLFYGGDLKVLGDVAGSVLGGAESVRVDTTIGKDIDMQVTSLTLGDRAEVMGDISYTSSREMVRSQNAVVVGEVVKSSAPVVPVSYDGFIITFVLVLFTALILQLLVRPQLRKLIPVWNEQSGVSGLVGLAALTLTPIVVTLAFASVLGAMLGFVLLLSFLLLFVVAAASTCIMLGTLLAKWIHGIEEPQVLYTILGAFLLQVLLLIPFIGFMAVFVLFAITFGGYLLYLYKAFRR